MTGLQLAVVAFGGLFLAGGVLMAIQRVRTVLSGGKAQGTVVGQSTSTQMRKSGEPVTLYTPVVEFAHDGRTFKFTSTMGTTSALPNGAKVAVVYLPGDPAGTAEIDSVMRLWAFPVLSIVVGGGLLGFGLRSAGYL